MTTDTFLATSILKKTLRFAFIPYLDNLAFRFAALEGGARIRNLLVFRGSSSIMALDVEGRVLGVKIGAVIRRFTFFSHVWQN